MERKPFVVRHWKGIVNALTIVALGVVVYLVRIQILDTMTRLQHLNLWVLALIVPLEALGYHAQAKMYQDMFKTVGNPVSYRAMLKSSLELNFINHILPSGGVSGISYFGLRLKSLGVPGSRATLVQTIKLMLVFLSFLLVLFAGVFLLSLHGQAGTFVIFVASVVSMVVIGLAAVFAYVIGSQWRVDRFFSAVTRIINQILKPIFRRRPEVINIDAAKRAFEEFHDAYVRLSGRLSHLKWPFWWALVLNITEVLVIYVVYMSFGEHVNIGAIILAYSVANFAGLISVLPGGVGIYEGLMIAIMAAVGISPAVSLPVTVTYRILNSIIQIVPGWYFYHQAIARGAVNKDKIEDERTT